MSALSRVWTLSGKDSYIRSWRRLGIGGAPAQKRLNSDSSVSRREEEHLLYEAASSPTSGVSFQGSDSFEEIRRGFDLSDERPPSYILLLLPTLVALPITAMSLDSVLLPLSSYGHVINLVSTVALLDLLDPTLMHRRALVPGKETCNRRHFKMSDSNGSRF